MYIAFRNRMKIILKLFFEILCFLVLLFSSIVGVKAATGGSGFAIYHANAFVFTYEWHSGIQYLPDINSTNAIIHEGKADNNTSTNEHTGVNYCSKNRFLNYQPFRGYYRPVQSISSAERDIVKQKANQLTLFEISYSLTHQMNYESILPGDKVEPLEITNIRCDGVVEYCYEYNSFKIYGTGNKNEWDGNRALWDITYKNTPASVHSIIHISPKKQAEMFMVNLLGDLDADCNVSTEDARLAIRFAIGEEIPNSYQEFVADVDGNGSITTEDARLILRFAVGLETVFPADPINNDLL